MSINLLDLAKGYLTNAAVEKVSTFLGEDSSAVTKAVGGVLPTLLGGLMNQGSTQSGLSSLMSLLNQGNNSGIIDNLGGMLSDKSQSEGLLSNGSGLISSILGNNSSSVIDAIGAFSGLKKSSTSSLLSIAAPLLMGVIGKQVKSSGMGLSGLASMLMGQKDHVKAAMPSGLSGVANLLNFNKLGDYEGVVSSAKEVVSSGNSGGNNWLKWLLPILAVLAALWAWRSCGDDVKDVAGDMKDAAGAVTDVATDAAGAVGDVAVDAASAVGNGIGSLGDFFKRKLPNGIELNIPEFGIESNLLNFIADGKVDKTTWFNFDRINFETGSSNLTAESVEQVKNVSEILSAYPNVKLKIGGYTDNTGSAAGNLKLSNDRANAVMNSIVANGISAGRLSAEGYGSEHPVATNDTEEGRAQNRRIAVRVTEK